MSNEALDADIEALNRQFLNLVARHSGKAEVLCLRLNISSEFLKKASEISTVELERISALGTCLLQPLIDGDTLKNASQLSTENARAHVRSAARLIQVAGR